MSIPVGQPRFCRAQIPATQQAAAVTAVSPLPRPDQEPGVRLGPVQVGVADRADVHLGVGGPSELAGLDAVAL